MSLSSVLIEQIQAEAEASKQVLERIPDSILDWKPHDKSWTTLELASHVANLVSWGSSIATTEVLDFASEEAQSWSPPKPATVAEAAAILEENSGMLTDQLASMTDADLMVPWVMRNGDHVIADDSRFYALTRWVVSHQSHHRGELMVYLRLNNVPLPPIFGPTADEGQM